MFQPVSSKVSFPELERRILDFWREHDVFRRSVEERPESRTYVFYEGPPTANGRPGLHHVLARVFKDLFPRYKTMRGYRVPRKGGWDTHGLPVELEVEQELGLRSKPEIEQFGVEEFNRRCRESVFRYVRDWEAMTERIAFWIDMGDAYVTYANEYIETCWWILKRLWDAGLVYQDYRSTPHCPRCGTSLSSHEVAQGYREDTVDPSVYVQFRVLPDQPAPAELRLADGVPTFFLAWTTTPWTLPGNTALAVDPGAVYAVAEVESEAGARRLVLAEALLDAAVGEHRRVVSRLPGRALAGLRYEPLYEPRDWGERALMFGPEGRLVPAEGPEVPVRRVVTADFVSLEDGTGMVHIAPAFGAEDFELGKAERLLYVQPVDLRGAMAPGSPWAGAFVKDADPRILDDLQARGLLWRRATVTHTYPFCWRCDTPLLYYAKPSWYIRTTAVKESLLEGNGRIHWYPEHIQWGRYGDWLQSNVDWAISRERYWGTPLPIWRCEGCDAYACVGSVAELRERAEDPAAVDRLTDLHRPYVDAVTLRCGACGGTMRRVREVADVWFDSGAMPYAQWHYPFQNGEVFQRSFPADFICEAVDQTRGWFYTLHAEAALLHAAGAVPDSIAYRHVICLGHILDEKGEKMSKSRGNVVDPWTVLETHGADALRWYLYTATPPGNARRFSANLVGESLRRFMLTLWNTYAFFVTYARLDGFDPARTPQGERSDLDRWLLSELNRLVVEVTEDLEQYNPTDAGRAIQAFVDDLSNWYVRRSRRRFWKGESDADKRAAYHTLYTALTTLSRLLAPFTPFLAEELYGNLVRSAYPDAPVSVHLDAWPEADPSLIDEGLNAEVRLAMRIVSLGRAARSKAQVKVRQPLPELLVQVRSRQEQAALERQAPQVLDELNVKALRFLTDAADVVTYRVQPNLPRLGPVYGQEVGRIREALAGMDPQEVARTVAAGRNVQVLEHSLGPEDVLVQAQEREGYSVAQEGGYTVAVSTRVTPELAAEGLARELVRRIQDLRRDAGFEIADRIVTYVTADGEVAAALDRFADYVKAETLSTDLVQGPPAEGAHAETQEVDGHRVTLAVRRVEP